MTFIFFIHIIATFCSLAIAWFLQIVHFPLLRYIGPYQYPVYYEQQKQKLTLITFPVMSLEIFSAVVLVLTSASKAGSSPEMERSFFTFLASVLLLLIIHLITFYFIKPLLKKLVTNWDETTLKQLKWYNLGRSVLWTIRLVVLLSTVIN